MGIQTSFLLLAGIIVFLRVKNCFFFNRGTAWSLACCQSLSGIHKEKQKQTSKQKSAINSLQSCFLFSRSKVKKKKQPITKLIFQKTQLLKIFFVTKLRHICLDYTVDQLQQRVLHLSLQVTAHEITGTANFKFLVVSYLPFFSYHSQLPLLLVLLSHWSSVSFLLQAWSPLTCYVPLLVFQKHRFVLQQSAVPSPCLQRSS